MLLIAFALTSVLVCVSGEIHCYCNSARCAAHGDVCVSQAERCFSQLSYDRLTSPGVHGCVEDLPKDDRLMCVGVGDLIRTRAKTSEGQSAILPVLMCCDADMCNYVDAEAAAEMAADWRSNNTSADGFNRDGSELEVERVGHVTSLYDASERWLRVAVVIVPMAGGVILVVLVLFALRLLRTDGKRQRVPLLPTVCNSALTHAEKHSGSDCARLGHPVTLSVHKAPCRTAPPPRTLTCVARDKASAAQYHKLLDQCPASPSQPLTRPLSWAVGHSSTIVV